MIFNYYFNSYTTCVHDNSENSSDMSDTSIPEIGISGGWAFGAGGLQGGWLPEADVAIHRTNIVGASGQYQQLSLDASLMPTNAGNGR